MKFYAKFEPLLYLNNSKYDVIALTGGRGSGKTQHTIRGLLLAMLQCKKLCCFFRETKDTVATSLMAEAEAIIEQDFPNRGFTTTQNEIRHLNGSVIFYKGLKEVNLAAIENLKGIASSTDFFFVDEAQSVSQAVWDVLLPTLRKTGSVLIVCYNRIKDDLPVENALFLDYQAMTAPDGTYFVEVNYPEILNMGVLSERFLKRAELVKKNKPKEYNMIYLNQPPDLSDRAIIKNFSKDNIRPIFYQTDMDLHISCDFNVDPMCWVFFHKTQNKLFYFDELVWENTTTQMCANEVIRLFPKHQGSIILNGDASGDFKNVAQKNPDLTNFKLLKTILERHYQKEVHIRIRRGNPRKIIRYNAFNELVKDINGENRVYFDPKCKWALYNIKNCMFKPGTTDPEEPTQNEIKADPNKKFLFHMLDAVTYPAEYYFPIK